MAKATAKEATPSATMLQVRLTPRADRNALVKYEAGVAHVRVTSAPVEGAANAALVALLAEALGVRKRAIIIVAGTTSREKRVLIEDLSPEQLVQRLAKLLPESTE